MASYTEWNEAIIAYFLQGVPRGSKIYLNVDDDLLEYIGQNFSVKSHISWNKDFQNAVRLRVVDENRVDLSGLRGRNNQSHPICVAFLSACVLAAYRMGEQEISEQEISDRNYFTQLRKILGLPTNVHGRPHGMEQGYAAEEPLWKELNRWLLQQGFQTSACSGEGAKRFINYPISQCLLRQADKDKLRRLFAKQNWTAQWDAQTLYVQVRREEQALSSHLRELFENRQIYETIAEAIHEVYQQWQAEGRPSIPRSIRSQGILSSNLFAGLYRTEDPLFGKLEYYLYPKQQRGRQFESVRIEYQNSTQSLRAEHSGWYLPLGDSLSLYDLENGVRCSITEPSQLDKLILPVRDFWVLIPDPENPDSGAYGSWGIPELGTDFILLCKRELLPDLERLKEERLLEWSGAPESYPIDDEQSSWVELNKCKVLSEAWDGVFIENQSLKDALQPTVKLSISFSGGLRVPKQRGWLEGYPPQIMVFGFYPRVELEVVNLLDEKVVVPTRLQKTNQPYPLDLNEEGTYLVKAKHSKEITEKIIKIFAWNSLDIAENETVYQTSINCNHRICGSVIEHY
ncbi:MAG: hypothetical protein WBB43_01710 [Limnoraphis sp.]